MRRNTVPSAVMGHFERKLHLQDGQLEIRGPLWNGEPSFGMITAFCVAFRSHAKD